MGPFGWDSNGNPIKNLTTNDILDKLKTDEKPDIPIELEIKKQENSIKKPLIEEIDQDFQIIKNSDSLIYKFTTKKINAEDLKWGINWKKRKIQVKSLDGNYNKIIDLPKESEYSDFQFKNSKFHHSILEVIFSIKSHQN